jgi:hypothetical protein
MIAQVETECRFGVGEVTSQGIKAKGQEEADGHIEWIMVKVRLHLLKFARASGFTFRQWGA